MRDTMWYLHRQHQYLEQLKAEFENQGMTWPISEDEDEARMKTELIEAIERNGPDNFHYSRGAGSGLRVPKHTNYAGDALEPGLKEEEEDFGMDMG